MASNDLISVIIPTYNPKEEELKMALKSVVSQEKDVNIEVLIIDEGSDGEHAKTIEDVCSKYQCARIIKKLHSGVSQSRNLGMKEAKVSYLIFMDADDTIDEGSYKKILNEFNKDRKLDVVEFGFKKSEDSKI